MRAFVTGGGGFVGRRIVELLRERGDEVVSYARGDYPDLARLGVRVERGDVADEAALARAMRGSDVVFHVAAKAAVWGKASEYEHTNVIGTRAVIAATRAVGIARLVFTSSPSVCFDGRDHVNASNDLPLAKRFLCDYPRTKAEAETLVLAANDSRLATCALRPHLVFGPNDPHLLPRLIDRARRGKLAIVGDGTNRVSLTYVDNAAWAHIDAADRLRQGAAHAGRAYFIAQEESVALWPWIEALLHELSISGPKRRLSTRTAYAVGAACEALWRLTRRVQEPPLTRFVALQLSTTHTYDVEPARCDFGYRERIALNEATRRSIAWLENQAAGIAGGASGSAGFTS
ncbi:MAG: NAD-dependent epimerase/dehydratase family protein [Planctomycetota bacterium]|nr:NAD-dependent epimerase/dehydratase family protein [Planctomycetota bacterium]